MPLEYRFIIGDASHSNNILTLHQLEHPVHLQKGCAMGKNFLDFVNIHHSSIGGIYLIVNH